MVTAGVVGGGDSGNSEEDSRVAGGSKTRNEYN